MNKAIQVLGEELAFHELRRRGYKLLLRNYECKMGTIDLIGKHENELVFIKVRMWSSGRPPLITNEKMRQLKRVAKFYMKRYGILDAKTRFDLVSVRIPEGKEPVIDVKVLK